MIFVVTVWEVTRREAIGDKGEGAHGPRPLLGRQWPAPVHRKEGPQELGAADNRWRSTARYRPGRVSDRIAGAGEEASIQQPRGDWEWEGPGSGEAQAPSTPTFSEAASAVHEANKPRWRNGSHTRAWIQTLERHASPKIGNKHIDTISRADVLTVLTLIWSTRPETARRVRQRMRTIFKWAMANELIETNPAGEAIDGALPSMPKVKAHLRALPYQEVGSALKTVDASLTSLASKHCLKFLVLTAARSGEARGANWDEINLPKCNVDDTRPSHEGRR